MKSRLFSVHRDTKSTRICTDFFLTNYRYWCSFAAGVTISDFSEWTNNCLPVPDQVIPLISDDLFPIGKPLPSGKRHSLEIEAGDCDEPEDEGLERSPIFDKLERFNIAMAKLERRMILAWF